MIYPSRAIDLGDHPYYWALLTSPEVHRVYLDEWAHSPQTLSQRLIHLLLAESQAAITEAQALLVQLLDSGPKALILDLIEMMLVYKLPALTRKEIQTMVRAGNNP